MFQASRCLAVLSIGALVAVPVAQILECESTNEAACAQESGCKWDEFQSSLCRNQSQGVCDGLAETPCNNVANAQCYFDGMCYLSSDACTNSLSETDCTGSCNFSTTISGYCTPDVIECYDFSENQTSCEAQRNNDGSQACTYSTLSNEFCGAYDACRILPSETACARNPSCSWDGTCINTNPNANDGLQDCTGTVPYDESTCSQSPRDGTNASSSCHWYSSSTTSCTIYDACAVATSQSTCESTSGCTWSGLACFESFGDDDFNTGAGTCELFDSATSCIGEVNSNGSRECSWISNSQSSTGGTCNPSDCRYGTETNCSSITNCQWLGSGSGIGGSGSFAGTCNFSPTGSGASSPCWNQQTQSGCESTSGCYYETFDNTGGVDDGYCGPYDPCISLTEAACSSNPACSFDTFTSSCSALITTPAPDPNSCYFPSQINQSACEAKQRDPSDPSTDPRCSYVSSTSRYCSIVDTCSQYTTQAACQAQSGCIYETLDETEPGSCYTSGGSGFSSGAQPCIAESQNACESEDGCEWNVQDNGYCTDWGLCVAGQSSATVCNGITGCWWEGWGTGDADGFCNEGTAPPPTTLEPTYSPVTPPPPTFFSCADDYFQCTEVDRCIPIAYRCDRIENDCPQNSDEENCPTVTPSPTTPRPCWSFEYECASGECVAGVRPRCNGVVQCTDGSDEVGCPTNAPTPVPPPPTTNAPISARPTSAPTDTPPCLSRCGNDISLLRRIGRNPRYSDSAECRACLTGYNSINDFCDSNPSPASAFCATGTEAPARDVVAFFTLPAGVDESVAANAIRNSLIGSIDGLDQSDFGGPGVVTQNVDGSYRVSFPMVNQAASDAASRRLNAGGVPVSINGQSLVASGTTGGGVPPAPTGGDENGSDDNGMMMIAIIVGVVVVIGAILIFVVIRKKKSSGGNARTRAQAKQTYMNPQYATAGSASNTPPWADPNVPFLTRAEAEATLKSRGMGNGDFVARQTANTVQGYVITAVNQGVISNSQLKRHDGQLTYGGKPLGNSLADAIATLQTKIKITPSNGPAYFLAGGGQSAAVGYDDGEADA